MTEGMGREMGGVVLMIWSRWVIVHGVAQAPPPYRKALALPS